MPGVAVEVEAEGGAGLFLAEVEGDGGVGFGVPDCAIMIGRPAGVGGADDSVG